MTRAAIIGQLEATMHAQPHTVRDLDVEQRNALIISMRKVDEIWIVVSRYGDDVWWPTGAPTNVSKGMTKLDFTQIPAPFRAVVKEMMYRLKAHGRVGRKQGGVSLLVTTLKNARNFL